MKAELEHTWQRTMRSGWRCGKEEEGKEILYLSVDPGPSAPNSPVRNAVHCVCPCGSLFMTLGQCSPSRLEGGCACLDLAQLPNVALRAHTPGDQAVSMEVTPKGLQGLRKRHVQGLTQQYTHPCLYMEATPNGSNTICHSVLGFLSYKMESLNSAHLFRDTDISAA